MISSSRLTFSNGFTAQAKQIQHQDELVTTLNDFGLHQPRPVLVIIGGASQVSEADLARLQSLFVDVLAPLAEELGIFVIDGGTDAGVMRLMGDARSITGGRFPLIGVAPVGRVSMPNRPILDAETTPLEPNHTHFMLVPGSNWGDESPWLAQIASLLADGAPSVTVLVNGGAIALIDVQENVKAGRPIVVIKGSGRLADEIAMAVRQVEPEVREPVSVVLRDGQISLFDLSEPTTNLEDLLRQKLSG
ncbi:hypothetical protein IQ268_03320 [Oculatella sp. LEGE 06141]|uniref:hypothetical protein n=1 Tax=Oculatella sp. LEGE 06141 TaxID=1828648 RepID=UPI001882BA16|nr:hypothetical protein [Oculatella sp. LEGE 06141]MBE9177607.1 hypothetical protein [Oculatella sp. LEGE 06141]